MPSPITRVKPNVRSRRLSGEQRPMQRGIAVEIVSIAKNASTMTIVFDQTVTLTGVPVYTTNLAGVTATAAVMTSPTTMALTFSAAITTATTLNVPFNDPAIRSMSGGYANAGSFPA